MKTVSFQGKGLSATQRARLAFEQQTRARFLNEHLTTQVNETLVAVEKRREEGAKPVRQWFLEYEAKGTPCVAELFGF